MMRIIGDVIVAWTLLSLTWTSRCVDGAKILVYPFGHCLNSHLLNAEKLVEILSADGHDVDMIVSTSYQRFEHHVPGSSTAAWIKQARVDNGTVQYSNHTSISDSRYNVKDNRKKQRGSVELVEFQEPDNYRPICEYDTLGFMIEASLSQRFNSLFHTFVRYCDRLLADRVLMNRLKSAAYDLLIVESVDPCGRVLADYLDVPFILLVTTGLGHFDSNPRPPSYLPAAIAPFTSDMNFGQRVANVLMKLMYDFVIPAAVGFHGPFEKLKALYGYNETLSVDDTFNRAALRLVNSDFSVDYPAPIQPDTVLVGGFAVDTSPPQLSPELEEFVSGSGDAGVIVVSFGTLVRHYDLEKAKIFLDAFSRLPQRVVWRNYGDEIESLLHDNKTASKNRYSNIRLMRWLPQTSLLAHPKTRLFISHCGVNAVFEAAHYGVPVLAMPLSGDHFHNAAKISQTRLGMGLTEDIRTLTAESLYSTIVNILTDESFRTNAKKVSRIMADQPISPAHRIKYWVDYVIRYGGARHLISEPSRKLSWFQYWSLDVAVCLIGVFLTAVYIFCRIFLVICKMGYRLLTKSVKCKTH